jgi:hypothetical protein
MVGSGRQRGLAWKEGSVKARRGRRMDATCSGVDGPDAHVTWNGSGEHWPEAVERQVRAGQGSGAGKERQDIGQVTIWSGQEPM